MKLDGQDIAEILEVIEDPFGQEVSAIPVVEGNYTDVVLTGHCDLEEVARIINKLLE